MQVFDTVREPQGNHTDTRKKFKKKKNSTCRGRCVGIKNPQLFLCCCFWSNGAQRSTAMSVNIKRFVFPNYHSFVFVVVFHWDALRELVWRLPVLQRLLRHPPVKTQKMNWDSDSPGYDLKIPFQLGFFFPLGVESDSTQLRILFVRSADSLLLSLVLWKCNICNMQKLPSEKHPDQIPSTLQLGRLL